MKELKTIISDKEVKRRTNIRTSNHHKKKRRNEKGLTKREQEKLEKLNIVKQLKDKGYKQKEIAKEIGVSIRMVKVYYKEVKKQNLQ
ncbi:helix-turn-helix domain-containing protein [Clostridium ganghwense]|uniref:Helix-turn-helix domain-containing protein n=1 Tax=Clostridium ganghwense TaxID=312089 RepID=A0ABT4CQB2_9CLOT|nr:helix-turn-helix domain-containing protein [Clostridium ganghwense]MCY6371237.1 helix-turn-helix domain-containing protein [Clostridium ganghwense]